MATGDAEVLFLSLEPGRARLGATKFVLPRPAVVELLVGQEIAVPIRGQHLAIPIPRDLLARTAPGTSQEFARTCLAFHASYKPGTPDGLEGPAVGVPGSGGG